MNFGGYQLTWSKESVASKSSMPLTISTVFVSKNYKYLFKYLPTEKGKEFSNLLDFSSIDKITQSLFATMNFFHQEAQSLAQKKGFDYRYGSS